MMTVSSALRIGIARTANFPSRRVLISRNFSSSIARSQPLSSSSSSPPSGFIFGEVLDHAVDLRNSRPGDRIDVPYELTITDAMQVNFQFFLVCSSSGGLSSLLLNIPFPPLRQGFMEFSLPQSK